MKIREIVVESNLEEGPLGNLVAAAGRGVGNVIGGVAKGAGAVKGAVKGAVDRVKKDFAAGEKGGYDALAGKPNAAGAATAPAAGATPAAKDTGTATPAAGAPASGDTAAKPAAPDNKLSNPTPPAGGDAAAGAPAAKQGILGKIGQAVKDFKKGYAGDDDAGIDAQKPAAGAKGGGTSAAPPGGAAQPAASDETPAAGGGTTAEPAAEPGNKDAKSTAGKPGQAAANDTEYIKVQKAADGLPPEQRQELIAALQADPEVKAALAKPDAEQPQAEPGKDAQPANTMANAPVSKVNKAKAGNPNAAKPAAEPTAVDATVNQKQLTDKGFGQAISQLTKKAG